MSIKLRLAKLEAALMPETTNYHIIRMIIDSDNRQPVGYCCEWIEVYRCNDEKESEFRNRLHDVIQWPIGKSSRRIFEPIYSED